MKLFWVLSILLLIGVTALVVEGRSVSRRRGFAVATNEEIEQRGFYIPLNGDQKPIADPLPKVFGGSE